MLDVHPNCITQDEGSSGCGEAPDNEAVSVREQAARIRDEHWGRTITYSRKVFIPLTTMCRNECGYCTFVKRPNEPGAYYMTPDEVLAVARKGQALGCKEALFSLGERPERRYPEARDALARLGFRSTADYLVFCCELVARETGLLPHANAGALVESELLALRDHCASMGMMLESTSRKLFARGMAHHACPDKSPRRRLATIEAATKLEIPFTTGILIGIGETPRDRIESLRAINEIHLRNGFVQEVIIQNFRAKPGTAMALWPEPFLTEMLDTIAAARLLLHPSISIQAPPNLSETYGDYIAAGINDWGGVSPVTLDHINPERAWPSIASLAAETRCAGYALDERLTVYPRFRNAVSRALTPAFDRLVADDGLAREKWVE